MEACIANLLATTSNTHHYFYHHLSPVENWLCAQILTKFITTILQFWPFCTLKILSTLTNNFKVFQKFNYLLIMLVMHKKTLKMVNLVEMSF